MAIKEERPITMAEVSSMVGDSEKSKEIKEFIKNFTELSVEKALEFKDELRKLGILKLKEAHIVKIVDFMPRDATELNKLIGDASLDSKETEKVLDVVRKY